MFLRRESADDIRVGTGRWELNIDCTISKIPLFEIDLAE